MIIQIHGDGSVELVDRDNFKAFKITAPASHASAAALGQALAGIAQVDAEGQFAWVSQDALRQWQGTPQPVEWIAAFDRMIESVKRFGWIDDAAGTVRGHVEIV
jgi:fructosamine-3-kinase